jgi:hypothetical protein
LLALFRVDVIQVDRCWPPRLSEGELLSALFPAAEQSRGMTQNQQTAYRPSDADNGTDNSVVDWVIGMTETEPQRQ